jgi:hypothetical protein
MGPMGNHRLGKGPLIGISCVSIELGDRKYSLVSINLPNFCVLIPTMDGFQRLSSLFDVRQA